MGAQIEWVGLKETAAAFKALPTALERRTLPRHLKKVAEIVVTEAKRRVPSRSGAAAASLKAKSTGQSASVYGGGKDVPYYGWLDFGGRTPREGNTRRAGPWTGSGKGPTGGRFIYPAIDARRAEILDAVGDAVDQAAREVGFR